MSHTDCVTPRWVDQAVSIGVDRAFLDAYLRGDVKAWRAVNRPVPERPGSAPKPPGFSVDLRKQPCFWCGGPGGTIDHYVPRSRGGSDGMFNLVSACRPCNRLKADMMPWEFRALLKVDPGERTER